MLPKGSVGARIKFSHLVNPRKENVDSFNCTTYVDKQTDRQTDRQTHTHTHLSPAWLPNGHHKDLSW